MNALSSAPTALLTEPIGLLGGANILQIGIAAGVVVVGALAVREGVQRLFAH